MSDVDPREEISALKAAVEKIWSDSEGVALDDEAASQVLSEVLKAVREQRRAEGEQ